MTMPTALPFGVRDIKIMPYTDLTATTLAVAMIDLPYARQLSFAEVEKYEDLRGDDQLVTSHGGGPSIEFDLESGGISLEAWGALTGGVVTTSGLDPNLVKRVTKRVTDQRPFFRLVGQSISDSGGDLWCEIYRARMTDKMEGSFEDEKFMLTQGSGQGFGSWVPGDENGKLYDFVQHQAITPIVLPVNEVVSLTITGAPTGGTFTLTYAAQTTGPIQWNATAAAVKTALEALSNIGVGDVATAGGPLPATGVTITFQSALGGQDVSALTHTDSLTGGTTPAVVITVVTPGAP